MRRKWFAAAGILVSLATSGCEILGLDEEEKVRVRNGSSVTLDEATVFLLSGPLTMTGFQAGDVSEAPKDRLGDPSVVLRDRDRSVGV